MLTEIKCRWNSYLNTVWKEVENRFFVPRCSLTLVSSVALNCCLSPVQIQPDTAFDLLYFSDLFLLSGLKNKCAAFLSQQLVQDNVILILKLARLYGLERLESHCAGFIAINLPEVCYFADFFPLILLLSVDTMFHCGWQSYTLSHSAEWWLLKKHDWVLDIVWWVIEPRPTPCNACATPLAGPSEPGGLGDLSLPNNLLWFVSYFSIKRCKEQA